MRCLTLRRERVNDEHVSAMQGSDIVTRAEWPILHFCMDEFERWGDFDKANTCVLCSLRQLVQAQHET